jgi:hypothetical protein
MFTPIELSPLGSAALLIVMFLLGVMAGRPSQ